MTKPEIITYKVYWKNDPNPLVVRGKSFAVALRLAGYDPNKVESSIDYFTTLNPANDEENNNVD